MGFVGVLVNGSVGDDAQPVGQGAIVTNNVETVEEACKWLVEMTAANDQWRAGIVTAPESLDKTMGSLRNDAHAHLRALISTIDQLARHDAETVAPKDAEDHAKVRAVLADRVKAMADDARSTAFPVKS